MCECDVRFLKDLDVKNLFVYFIYLYRLICSIRQSVGDEVETCIVNAIDQESLYKNSGVYFDFWCIRSNTAVSLKRITMSSFLFPVCLLCSQPPPWGEAQSETGPSFQTRIGVTAFSYRRIDWWISLRLCHVHYVIRLKEAYKTKVQKGKKETRDAASKTKLYKYTTPSIFSRI